MQELTTLLDELKTQSFFKKDEVCVIGCSTSEVIGKKLGQLVQWKLLKLFLMNWNV